MAPIDRTNLNAMVDDDGTNTTGTLVNKAKLASVIFDPIDAAINTNGTWTPSDGSGAGLSFTITTTAVYSTVGRIVFFQFAIVYPATANGSLAVVAGLPFTNSTSQFAGTTIYTDYGDVIVTFIAASGTTIGFYTKAAVALTNANLSGKIIRASGFYFK